MRISDWISDVCSSDLDVPAGEAVGYGATWTARCDSRIAVANIGYADGYLRCHAGTGGARFAGQALPLVGRVSMDLVAFDASRTEERRVGEEWVGPFRSRWSPYH